MKNVRFECDCSHASHNMRVSYFEDEKDQLYFEIALNKLPWHKRLKVAIKYLLGQESWYYEEIILNPEEASKLKSEIDLFLKSK